MNLQLTRKMYEWVIQTICTQEHPYVGIATNDTILLFYDLSMNDRIMQMGNSQTPSSMLKMKA